MFKKLKDAIESALEALEGKSGDASREDVEKLLDGMREELIDTKSQVPLLEAQVKLLHLLLCNIQVTCHACFFHRRGFLVEIPCAYITTASPYSVNNLSGFLDSTPCEQRADLFTAVATLFVKTP